MRYVLTMALAAAVGVTGFMETTPSAQAAPLAAPATSVEQVRADAMARLAAGDIQTVGHHRGRGGGRHFRGGGRHWGGGRHYGGRRYYGGRGYYYGRRHHHGHGGAVAAGVAGLIIGSAIASSASRSPCARGYRSYVRNGHRYYCR